MSIDAENTLRTLADKPLIMTWPCRLGFHTYTVWTVTETSFSGDKYNRFTKTCIHCNMVKQKVKKVPTY